MTNRIWIKFPTAAPANPKPNAHKTNRTINNVQSIFFSYLLFCEFNFAVFFAPPAVCLVSDPDLADPAPDAFSVLVSFAASFAGFAEADALLEVLDSEA